MSTTHQAVSSAVGATTEELVAALLLQIIVILVVTRVVVALARRFLRQTDVAGEILAGLLLGPSALGAVAPEVSKRLFVPSTSGIFVGMAQLGLILLMFEIGLEFEFKAKLSGAKHKVLAISGFGIATPFALGYLTAPWFLSQMADPAPDGLTFRLFFATAMSITAIPILGRIFMELGVAHTATATLTISAAAIDDVAGWLILGVVSALSAAQFSTRAMVVRIALLAVFFAFIAYVMRPLLRRLVCRPLDRSQGLDNRSLVLLLAALFVCAFCTSKIGVFAVIGAFGLGMALHEERRLVTEWKSRVSPLVRTLLLPLFFTYTGLRTDVGTLTSTSAILQCVAVCAIAFAGKFGGTYMASRLVGESHRNALTIGICMNTRALMELIVLNVGRDLGVVPPQMFTMLVLMAIVSTYVTTPAVRYLMRSERRPVGESRGDERNLLHAADVQAS